MENQEEGTDEGEMEGAREEGRGVAEKSLAEAGLCWTAWTGRSGVGTIVSAQRGAVHITA